MGLIVLQCVFGGLVLFVLYMLVVTASLGTERFKVAQFLMSSLRYSEEATIKLNLLIDKYEAGILKIKADNKSLVFYDPKTQERAGEIWVGNKYYSYGILYRYGATDRKEWACNKPDIKTFKRIIKLEKSLDKNEPEHTSTMNQKDSKVEEVILE